MNDADVDEPGHSPAGSGRAQEDDVGTISGATSEADRLDQRRPVDPAAEPTIPRELGLGTEVPEADALEQAITVSGADEEEWR